MARPYTCNSFQKLSPSWSLLSWSARVCRCCVPLGTSWVFSAHKWSRSLQCLKIYGVELRVVRHTVVSILVYSVKPMIHLCDKRHVVAMKSFKCTMYTENCLNFVTPCHASYYNVRLSLICTPNCRTDKSCHRLKNVAWSLSLVASRRDVSTSIGHDNLITIG